MDYFSISQIQCKVIVFKNEEEMKKKCFSLSISFMDTVVAPPSITNNTDQKTPTLNKQITSTEYYQTNGTTNRTACLNLSQ
ncbi:MAG: hypothetical protein BRD50_04565 [Bacteroidetes bacterium SW_11_45_7]|nr:MAG: hypothetical protein BRD50_04565 [Bacteroidetes bacterium SW_11_45_7]